MGTPPFGLESCKPSEMKATILGAYHAYAYDAKPESPSYGVTILGRLFWRVILHHEKPQGRLGEAPPSDVTRQDLRQ
jgi:hypothetical protein